MIPPQGFKAELYPLRHRFNYSFGLSAATGTTNSTIITLVKNYKTLNAPDTIDVNPHHASFDVETGAICQPMSIIEKLKLVLKFNLLESARVTDNVVAQKVAWTPIFFSFGEKLDAADEETTSTVASILSLTKDATQLDVTPAFATKLPTGGPAETPHPVTTVNMTEVFGTLNLTTDTGMEGVPHSQSTLLKGLKYYTNKGALKACIGQTRNFVLNEKNGWHKSFFIDKFVPRAVRRIVDYSYFGILIHVPLYTDVDQYFIGAQQTAALATVGVKANVTYHEWNPEHHQDMSG